ncbi:hypothetical protein [Bacteroides sp. 519]|uniref:hypothetical protein n=1 Tax=Bacteroides sp. 519 TaxID=2302937 RepID=UPI0013D53CB4|nr:hypothetical protein [Bacteroides sp. 519]NDV58194.1 hypothetical protein [Bacteroides sp. 519]
MIENYTKEIVIAREISQSMIKKEYPNVLQILGLMDSYVVSIINRFENISGMGEIDNYKLALIVSFLRTQLIISEHILDSELVEATVLERKQIELIARLSEIDKKVNNKESLHKLKGKTPNVGNGNVSENLKNMYGMFSEIAHSAKTEPFALIMMKMEDNKIGYSVLPEYDSTNTIVALNNHIQLFFDFFIYMLSFQKEFFPNYTDAEDMELINNLIEEGIIAKLSVFDRFK